MSSRIKSPDAGFQRIASLSEVQKRGCYPFRAGGRTLVLFTQGDQVFCLDNRCPHMGFPLHRGSVQDGLLTCHWHHARFDLKSGGTFDPWTDDVAVFPVRIEEAAVWVDLSPAADPVSYRYRRLREGLEQDIPLVMAKNGINLLRLGQSLDDLLLQGLDFATTYNVDGWSSGLTILACMKNLSRYLPQAEVPRAGYHALCAVARECQGQPPRFSQSPLPGPAPSLETLTSWFRKFVRVRDPEGAERCLVTAVEKGVDNQQLSDMLFAAVTDYRYLHQGHVLDFANKAFEVLDWSGADRTQRSSYLGSLVPLLCAADRMEDSNSWRHPVDLIELLEGSYRQMPEDSPKEGHSDGDFNGRKLRDALLEEGPEEICRQLLEACAAGVSGAGLASLVTSAAALRLVRFHESNEHSDWDTVLHTFTYAHAVHMAIRRAPSRELLRAVFDAAMSVYLDRFLNVPPARIPRGEPHRDRKPESHLRQLVALFDRKTRVEAVASSIADYLASGWDVYGLECSLVEALLNEDRDFHTIQAVDAALQEHELAEGDEQRSHFLIAAGRYLAAHTPTLRSQTQTFELARRLERGEALHEES